MTVREASASLFTDPPVPLAEDRFRLAVEAASVAMIMVDRVGRIVMANPQAGRLFGYPREELLEQPAEFLLPERLRSPDVAGRSTFFDQPKAEPVGVGRDLWGLRRDGSEVPVEIGLTPITTSEGAFVLASIVDITDSKRTEQELRDGKAEATRAQEQIHASLQEKEVLLREIHHRVKNNLQVIASLLNLQADLISDERAHGLLMDTQARVRSMALIHEKLYESTSLAEVNLGDYLRELVVELFRFYTPMGVQYEVQAAPISVNIDTATPCGLIANELISNCLKHAFPGGRGGRVSVRLNIVEPGRYALVVQDDGVGLPPNLEARRSESLGLLLVDTLARQLGASLEVESKDGTSFYLRFQETIHTVMA